MDHVYYPNIQFLFVPRNAKMEFWTCKVIFYFYCKVITWIFLKNLCYASKFFQFAPLNIIRKSDLK